MERLGKVNDPVLGPSIRVRIRTWEGPENPGDAGKYHHKTVLFPIDQRGREMHPRHPTGYDPETREPRMCVSPSGGLYGELCRYGQFTFLSEAERQQIVAALRKKS